MTEIPSVPESFVELTQKLTQSIGRLKFYEDANRSYFNSKDGKVILRALNAARTARDVIEGYYYKDAGTCSYYLKFFEVEFRSILETVNDDHVSILEVNQFLNRCWEIIDDYSHRVTHNKPFFKNWFVKKNKEIR